MAGAFDTGRALPQSVKDIIQANIENGYSRFLQLVAEGRNMTVEQVDAIAQGRVWSGVKAKELGLVDHLGSYKDAIKAAAKRANLEEGKYDIWWVKRELSQNEELIKQLFDSESQQNIEYSDTLPKGNTPVMELMRKVQLEMEKVKQFNDPNHAYVHCNCELY
jgi:protease-4